MIKALAHTCFVVRDLAAAEAFYRGKLGLQHAFDFINDSGERFGAYLHVGGRSFLELFQGQPEAPSQSSSFRHICLEVEDLEAAVAKLRGQGLEVPDPALGSDNTWQVWLSDPDGNRIELHQYTAQSLQTPSLA